MHYGGIAAPITPAQASPAVQTATEVERRSKTEGDPHLRERRDHDHGEARPELAELAEGFEAVLLGHHDVEQDEVGGGALTQGRHGGLAGAEVAHAEGRLGLEPDSEQPRVGGVVVHDEDVERGHRAKLRAETESAGRLGLSASAPRWAGSGAERRRG